MRPAVLFACLALAACSPAAAPPAAPRPAVGTAAAAARHDADTLAVARVLDAFHAAASRADGAAYFGLMTPDAVFIGTDATERWTRAAFEAYAGPYFSQGRGWTYTPTVRHVDLVPGGSAAYFDELLENTSYGTCRGTGVVVRTPHGWKVAQYHLTIPVPNDLAREVVDRIRAQ